jgi:hypothetical protein
VTTALSTSTAASGTSANKIQGKDGVPVSAQQQARAELNTSIVQSYVALNSKTQPQSLLASSAINGINEALKPQLGENAIQNAAGDDNSAAATASRIVSGATGLYAAFKAQHPDESDDDALKDFMSTIRSGFEKGFSEAADILKGLGVLGGDVASGINQTHDLVLKGFDDFEKAHQSTAAASDGASSASASASASASTSSSASVTLTGQS